MLGGFELPDGQVDDVLVGRRPKVEVGGVEEVPSAVRLAIRIVVGSSIGGNILGAGLTEAVGRADGGFDALLGGAGRFLALEAVVAFELLHGGDVAVGVDDAGAAAQTQGLIQLQEIALEGGEVGRRRG